MTLLYIGTTNQILHFSPNTYEEKPTFDGTSQLPWGPTFFPDFHTSITYKLAERKFVELGVVDVLGRNVATLVNEDKLPGEHSVVWDANGLASGVYYYRLRTGSFTETKKMVLLR